MISIPFVDRAQELALLKERLNNAKAGKPSTVLVRGATGIGKTRLCSELMHVAAEMGFKNLYGSCISRSAQPLIAFEDALKCAGLEHLIEEGKVPRIESIHIFIDGKLVSNIERERLRVEEVSYTKVREFACTNLIDIKESGEEHARIATRKYGNYEVLYASFFGFLACVIVYGKVKENLIKDVLSIIQNAREKQLSAENADTGSFQREITGAFSALVKSGKYDGIDWAEGMVDTKKLNLFENVMLGLSRVSRQQPIVLFIDDLHLADSSTIELFMYIARNSGNARILILGTINSDLENAHKSLNEAIDTMKLEDAVEFIALSPLTPDATYEIVERTLSINSDVFKRKICEKTGGNPLFISEFIFSITDILQTHADAKQEPEKILSTGKLPKNLSEFLITRFEKMSREARELGMILSVLNAGEPDLILNISGLSEEAFQKGLQELSNAEFITNRGTTWMFTNTTIGDVIYEKMTHTRRTFLHKKALQFLKEAYANDARWAGEILRHARILNDKKVVGDYGILAGDFAMARYSTSEALEHYLAGLEFCTQDQRAHYIEKILGALDLLGRYAEAVRLIDDELAKSNTEDERAKMLRRKAEIFVKMGEYPLGMECAREALRIWQRAHGTQENVELANIYSILGVLHEKKGEYTDAMRWQGRALKILEHLKDVESKRSFVYNRLGVICWHIGDYKMSERYYMESLKIAEASNDLQALSRCYNNLGVLYRNRGEPAKALEYYKKSLEIDEKIGDRWGIEGTSNNIGIVLHEMGRIQESLEYYQRALAIASEIGDMWGIAVAQNNIGIGYYEMGELEKARSCYTTALKICEKINDQRGVAIAYNNLGDVYSAMDDVENAREHYTKSAEICRAIGSIDFLFNATHGLVDTALNSMRMPYCEEKIAELEKLADTLADKKKIAMVKVLRARLEAIKGNISGARNLFQSAEAHIQECNELIELAKIKYIHGITELKYGDKEKACAELENAHELFTKFGMNLWASRTLLALKTR